MNAYQIPADPTAVMGRRIAAYIIDAIIGMAVFVVMLLAVGDNATFSSSDDAADACDFARDFGDDPVLCFNAGDQAWAAEGSDALTILGVSFVAGIVNNIVLAGTVGGSVGKLAMGLRIVNKNTGRIAGIGPNIIRTLLWIVDAFPYCFPLVGLITGLATKGHRRVGDMAASTLVVGKGSVGQPPHVPGLSSPAMAGAGGYPPMAPGGGWDPSAPPPPPTWGAPVPPPPSDPWSQPSAPGAPTSPSDSWSSPGAQAPAPPADPWAAPAAPAPPPAPEPTTSFEQPSYEQPAPEPASYESPSYEPASFESPASETRGSDAPGSDAPPSDVPAFDVPSSEVPADEAPASDFPAEPASYEPPAAEPAPSFEAPAAAEPPPSFEAPASAEPAGEPAAQQASASETPGVNAPTWDAARNAYIQWDPSLNAWMQWDDASQQWRPIS